MSRRDFKMLQLASEIAAPRDDNRIFFLGCVAVRNDGKIVKSRNESTFRSPFPTGKIPLREAHAEYRVAQKIDYDSEIFVARVKADGSWGVSRPCKDCLKALITKRVKRICYTIAHNEYGVITF